MEQPFKPCADDCRDCDKGAYGVTGLLGCLIYGAALGFVVCLIALRLMGW